MSQSQNKRVCSVPQCTNSHRKQPYLGFHEFPSDVDLRNRWVQAIKRSEGPNFTIWRRSAHVCSLHFSASDTYTSKSGRKRLRTGAVPCRFRWNDWGKGSLPVQESTIESASAQLGVNVDYISQPPPEQCSVRIKVEEEYDQVLVEETQSYAAAEEPSSHTEGQDQHCTSAPPKTYSSQTVYNDPQREAGGRPSSSEARAAAGGRQMGERGCSPGVKRWRGSGSLTSSMGSEGEDESFFDDVTRMEMEYDCQTHYEQESAASKEDSFGTDHLRTLGEILAYCQVMYGAIQKLDEKFEQLQAKVTNVQAIHLSPALLQQTGQKAQPPPSNADAPQVRTDTPYSLDAALPMPQLVRVCSPPPPPSGEGKKPPPLSPAPGVPSPPRLKPQRQPSQLAKTIVAAHLSSHMLPLSKAAGKQLRPPAAGGAVATATHRDPATGYPSPEKTRCLGSRKRRVFIPSSTLQKVEKMPRPGAAARFLLRSIFTLEELTSSNTMGDPARGLNKLDPNKITAIREWAAKRYPTFDLREKGKDWKACLSVINSTARYLRLVAKKRKLKKQKESGAALAPLDDPDLDLDPESPFMNPTAEIDVELSDGDSDGPSVSHESAGTKDKQKRAATSNSKSDTENEEAASKDSYEYLGDPQRQVRVPQFAMVTARLRARPELVARFLIKYIFTEDVLVRSNVYGNTDHGIHRLDHNKITALREHLLERFPWLLLEEDGQDWKACVGAINSTIRKFRHERKKGKSRKKGR